MCRAFALEKLSPEFAGRRLPRQTRSPLQALQRLREELKGAHARGSEMVGEGREQA